MAKRLRNLLSAVLFGVLGGLLALTFAVFSRNSFDLGDIAADLPLLIVVWAAFAVLLFAARRSWPAVGWKRSQHP